MAGRRTILGLAVAIAAAGACKEKPAETAAAAPPPPPMPQEVTVHARDFAFDAPDTISAGLTAFKLINDGPGLHHAQLLRIDSSKTVDEALAAIKAAKTFPVWLVASGGPNAVAPGDSNVVVQELAAGHYLWICFVDIPGHVPHFVKGMDRELVVRPATGPAATPAAADINVTLRSFGFDFSAPLTAGRHTFRVETAANADQGHELVMFKLDSARTDRDFMAYMQDMYAGKAKGPPPARPVAGVAEIRGGMPVEFTADITPGDYLLICFLPDITDGKPHFMHGMMQTIHVS